MTITIKAPDGSTVNFPDGTDDGTITSIMAKNYPVQSPALRTSLDNQPLNNTRPTTSVAAKPGDTSTPQSSFGLGFDQGVVQPVLNAGAAIEGGLKSIGLPMDYIDKNYLSGHTAAEIRDAHAQWLQDQQDPSAKDNDAPGQSRTPSLGGEIVGGTLSTLPVLAATRNPWLLGAAQGALNTQSDTPGGIATDTALSTGFGKLGDVGVKAAGAVVSPIWRASVNKLLGEGVKLTPGQITGGALHRIEDATMSFPALGDLVMGASDRSQDSFIAATANRALTQIGETMPGGVKPGNATVEHVQNAFRNEYNSIMPQMKISYSKQLGDDINSLEEQAAQDLNPDMRNQFSKLIKSKVISVFNRGSQQGQGLSGTIDGEGLKDIETTLNNEARQFGRSTDPFYQKYASYVQDLKAAVHDEMGRQNPTLKPRLDAADKGYAYLSLMEAAANSARGGRYNAALYDTAVRNASHGVRRGAGTKLSAAGKALGQDLSSAGTEVLTRTVPDSGTPMRALVNGASAAALYGAAPHLAVNPLALGGAAAMLSPYTKAGGAVARTLMASRPAFAPALRRVIDKAAIPANIAAAHEAIDARNSRGRYRQNGTAVEYQPPGSNTWQPVGGQ